MFLSMTSLFEWHLTYCVEQIEQAQQDVDVINEQITYGEAKIQTIESTCAGCCSCFEKKGKRDVRDWLETLYWILVDSLDRNTLIDWERKQWEQKNSTKWEWKLKLELQENNE